MMVYEMLAMSASGEGAWTMVNIIAASAGGAKPEVMRFGAASTLLGLLIHMVAAGFWGTRFRYVHTYAPRVVRGPVGVLVLGALWGVAVWFIMGLISRFATSAAEAAWCGRDRVRGSCTRDVRDPHACGAAEL